MQREMRRDLLSCDVIMDFRECVPIVEMNGTMVACPDHHIHRLFQWWELAAQPFLLSG
jgi:hypothetical protein